MWKNHYLMSLDTPLLKMEVLPSDGTVGRILEVYNKKLLPYGLDGNRDSFVDWNKSRRIPASRKHMKTFRYRDKIDYLLYNSMALSLSDSFWIKPVELKDTWKDVNFYDNDFTDDVGECLINGEGQILSLISPSNTTDGVYPKKWVIIDGFRALAKVGDRDSYKYDDVSEIIASELLQILCSKSRVPYATYFRIDKMTCASWNFVKAGQNLVNAYRYLLAQGCDPEYSPKDICLQIMNESIAKESIDIMLILDYIIFNADRHFGNFGFIQDARTGELTGAAPIYDSGCSLFAALGAGVRDDLLNKDFKSRSFAPTHDLQIRYVNVQKYKDELELILEKVETIFYEEYLKVKLKEDYIKKLLDIVKARINKLLKVDHLTKSSVFST